MLVISQVEIFNVEYFLIFRYKDDNSYLSRRCSDWGVVGNKWGTAAYTQLGLADHTLFVYAELHWLLKYSDGKFLCDNKFFNEISVGDFWKVYVRY